MIIFACINYYLDSNLWTIRGQGLVPAADVADSDRLVVEPG
jgi:hypothetical protein